MASQSEITCTRHLYFFRYREPEDLKSSNGRSGATAAYSSSSETVVVNNGGVDNPAVEADD